MAFRQLSSKFGVFETKMIKNKILLTSICRLHHHNKNQRQLSLVVNSCFRNQDTKAILKPRNSLQKYGCVACKSTKVEPMINDEHGVEETEKVISININNNNKEELFQPRNEPNAGHPDMDMSFNNPQEAYRSKKTSEVFRALLVFNLCSFDWLIKNQKKVCSLVYIYYSSMMMMSQKIVV